MSPAKLQCNLQNTSSATPLSREALDAAICAITQKMDEVRVKQPVYRIVSFMTLKGEQKREKTAVMIPSLPLPSLSYPHIRIDAHHLAPSTS